MLTKGDVLAHLGRIKDPRGTANKLKDMTYLPGPSGLAKPVSLLYPYKHRLSFFFEN
jgi:hypothetical protein